MLELLTVKRVAATIVSKFLAEGAPSSSRAIRVETPCRFRHSNSQLLSASLSRNSQHEDIRSGDSRSGYDNRSV